MRLKSKVKLILALFVVLVFLNWSTITDLVRNGELTGNVVQDLPEVYEEESVEPHVYFCGIDDCLEEMILWLDAAEEYIHCALFEVELEELKEKLTRNIMVPKR